MSKAGGIHNAFIMPHPPLIIPEVGQGRETEIQSIMDACQTIAKRIAKLHPDTIVRISPHGTIYADYFHISPGASATGHMGRFGARQVKLHAEYDEGFIEILSKKAQCAGLPTGT